MGARISYTVNSRTRRRVPNKSISRRNCNCNCDCECESACVRNANVHDANAFASERFQC